MKQLLISCFYDGMSVSEAVAFISRCYQETPTPRQIQNAKKTIKACTGIDWV